MGIVDLALYPIFLPSMALFAHAFPAVVHVPKETSSLTQRPNHTLSVRDEKASVTPDVGWYDTNWSPYSTVDTQVYGTPMAQWFSSGYTVPNLTSWTVTHSTTEDWTIHFTGWPTDTNGDITIVFDPEGKWKVTGKPSNMGICIDNTFHCGVKLYPFLCCYLPGQQIPCPGDYQAMRCTRPVDVDPNQATLWPGKKREEVGGWEMLDDESDDTFDDGSDETLDEGSAGPERIVGYTASLSRLDEWIKKYPTAGSYREGFVANADALGAQDPLYTTYGDYAFLK